MVVAGLGDTGVLVATRLARSCDVVGISTRPALVSGQELGARLTDPARWRRTYFVPYSRLRRLDRIRLVLGRISAVDLEGRRVHIEQADGTTSTEPYDVLVIATGASNGFWRHDRIEDLVQIDAELGAVSAQLDAASCVAVVGGGATGVSRGRQPGAARWRGRPPLSRRHVPLPGYHPQSPAVDRRGAAP